MALRLPEGATLGSNGFIHTPYGTYNPVTGEGSLIDPPPEFMRQILIALLREGEESGPAEEFDFDAFMAERFTK